MSTSVCSISIIVGNRCSLRGLHTTQHNRCVLESRRLHPPKHKFSLRFSLDKYLRSREHRYDTRTSHPRPQKTVPGSATPRHPVELLCAAMGDSTLTSNRAPDWYMSTTVRGISIIVGNRCSLRGLHATQHNRCVLESGRLHPPKHKFSLRLSCSGTYWRLIESPIILFLISETPIREPHTPSTKKTFRAARLHTTQ